VKFITSIALALVMLCFACAEIKSPQKTVPEVQETIEEERNAPESETHEQITEVPTEEDTTNESTLFEPATVDEEPKEKSTEEVGGNSGSDETIHAKTGGAEESSEGIEHAKTGYDGGETGSTVDPIPAVETPADLQIAMDAACAYAMDTYGVAIDSTLNMSNSAYRFPAVVPETVSQETLNAKAIDMVEFTFQQLIRVDGLTMQDFADLGIRCNVYCCHENDDILTYVFYDG